ncbi:16S rRNA (cytidine(1402)-2'-O)-methyltransferase [Candidatus Liberibacter sp.]|uniref:16S rRNA (cytidine(1402)-2'-O)-methyltransferase n=1 Tax=Candidatus Liberibacter sp. TaxID=34022 RepID=UPI0015F6ECD6|nr:16S rRNA (cytidine(1402)-2'-O)-methyltransferase [Candidatus Liberibacter sp.]MBA5723759.1 16S rRNA (cytidine(1402)-2'-O)-methyltransferase [Candidatus Liberibacter sp.]
MPLIQDEIQKLSPFFLDRIFTKKPLDSGLYIVSTPIGNLEDITIRALNVLSTVDVVACEDTRLTGIFLKHYGIHTKLCPYHEHNSKKMGEYLLESLQKNLSIALVSDAGTPMISDPGYHVVNLAIQGGHRVIPIPGSSAPLAALVGSGLPSNSFLFIGFLSSKSKARRDKLLSLITISATLIFFESPHRILETLIDIADILGKNRPATVCREITKVYEEFQRDTVENLIVIFSKRTTIKGEIVLVIGPPEKNPEIMDEQELNDLLTTLCQKMSKAQAAREAARITGIPRKKLYTHVLGKKIEDVT